jgi:CDP-diacylglycerol--serine O-phosphatidyltransferase
MMMFFMGLPTPAAAGAVLIPVMLFATHSLQLRLPEWLVIAHTLVIAWLMISRIPTFSIKKIRINRRLAPLLMVAVGLLVVGASKEPWLTAAGITAAYLLTIPLSIVTAGRLKRKMGVTQQSRAGAGGLGPPIEPQRSFVEQSAPHQ